jgi:hypothetical protein
VTYLTYAKWAAIAGVGVWIYHLGGASDRAALAAQHAAQLQAVVKAMDENAREAAAAQAHLQGVIDAYHATPIDPIVPGIAHRVYVVAAGTCSGRVPEARSVAPGTQAPAALPIGPSNVERSLGDYIAACASDAAQMKAMIQLAP